MVIKFASDLRQVGGYLRVLRFPPPTNKTDRHDITEILLKVELNIITLTLKPLISIVGKIMERSVYKYIHNYLLANCIITPHQSESGNSAINQLLFITNEFGKALDEGKKIRVVFCDISKAFDRVWHIGLLKEIESIGIQGPLLSWIKNYLSNRKQRVVLIHSNSQWRDIKAGVPRGSILGSLLFIIFINDIVTDIQSTIKLFADDTSLYLIVNGPNETADSLNNDLAKIHDWATK
jgi:hypothetical protein